MDIDNYEDFSELTTGSITFPFNYEVIMPIKKGILYHRSPAIDGRRGWYEGREGDDEKDEEGYTKYGKYEGEIENGKPNGKGTYTATSRGTYIGEFKDGLRDGQGTFTWYESGKFIGVYKDNRRWNGIKYDEKGNIKEKLINGKIED